MVYSQAVLPTQGSSNMATGRGTMRSLPSMHTAVVQSSCYWVWGKSLVFKALAVQP